jgi:hypothetical protein
MGWFGDRISAFSDGIGPRRFALGAVLVAVTTAVKYAASRWLGPGMSLDFPPWMAGALVLLLLIAWWMLEYAVRLRRQLRGAVNLETSLDTLSQYFDEGNSQLFNARITNAAEYGTWKAEWKQWDQKVKDHIETSLGLREKNLFSNIVLLASVTLLHGFSASHSHDLNILYRQLETIRDIILRHSERADQWRIRGLQQGPKCGPHRLHGTVSVYPVRSGPA